MCLRERTSSVRCEQRPLRRVTGNSRRAATALT
jgi:hypothetical protein